MKILVPNYYDKFKCIADKCTHSCCIGWEIDIDTEKLNYYNSLSGDLGNMLKENIATEPEPHFILKEGDRCPFLKDNGLCHIICCLGEEALCNICTDHPRFRNYCEKGVEMGIGLCCEEACKVILTATEPFSLVGCDDIYSDYEKHIADIRHKLISVVQDRNLSLTDAFENILDIADAKISGTAFEEYVKFFLSLERLDESWTNLLEDALSMEDSGFANCNSKEFRIPLEQLAVYFLYRHVPAVIYGETMASVVGFSVLSTLFIHTLALKTKENYPSYIDALCNVARMYSSEVEYSDDNLQSVFMELSF